MNAKVTGLTLFLILFSSIHTLAQQQRPQKDRRRHDVGKMMIESPLIDTVAPRRNKNPERVLDTSKRRIESPVESLIEKRGKTQPRKEPRKPEAPQKPRKENDANPQVKPGAVKWHQSIEHARKASRESGKPLLIFYLLGQLDREFT